MAKPKRVLIDMLQLLNRKSLKKSDIRNNLKISRKTEFKNLKLAMQRKWIELDDLGFYHITTLGKDIQNQ